MSNKELAYSLIDRMTEKQLAGLIDLLTGSIDEDEHFQLPEKDPQKMREAYERIMKMIRPCPNLSDDYKQEYLDYLDERYGV